MRHPHTRWRVPITTVMAIALALPLSLPAQAAAPTPPDDAAQGWAGQADAEPHRKPDEKPEPKPRSVAKGDRAAVLGPGHSASKDTAFTTSGDGTGFHLLVADERDGYAWKAAATLSEDGFDADTWIGNACLTGSGKYAAVAYAPRAFTNKPELMVRGAFTAVVDLGSGEVTKLPFTASLAHFSPGCGTGRDAVFTQLSWDGDAAQKTRLISVDAATGKASRAVSFPGQVTSAVPTREGIVAAHGNKLVRINGSRERVLAAATAVPFQITADGDGGVTFIDRQPEKTDTGTASWAKHLTSRQVKAGKKATPVTVASGRLRDWDLTGTPSGQVFITGKAAAKGALPDRVRNPGRLAKGARMSSHGHAAVSTTWADGKTSLITPSEADAVRDARTTLRVLATGKTVTLDVTPKAAGGNARTGRDPSPALGLTTAPRREPGRPGGPKPQGGAAPLDTGGMSAQTVRTQPLAGRADSPSEGTDERYCGVARNDVRKQAFQPTPRQVEWAVDQAVVGELNFYRSPNWKNTGMGGYQPQGGLFPATVLAGDPNGTLDNEDPDVTDRWHIPSQVMLGVTAQESNMWQATRFAVPGVTANSLIGNYYGTQYTSDGTQADPWRINFSEADCGYGITQATDGMRLSGKEKDGETALSTYTQEAVALDYTANIAYGVRILSDKWNQTYRAGMKVNDGHPQWIENWFFALWAYNSGFYPTADAGGHKGLGWTNNPANPLWKANRVPFLQSATDPARDDYSHAAHPQDWPYQEKVLGWAARPISAMFAPGDFRPGYLAAWWNSNADRSTVKPPLDLFCDASNDCDPSKIGDNDSNDPGLGACELDAGDSGSNPHWLHCWWDKPAEWKNCDTGAECGHQVHRFNTSYPEQPDANSYPPRCSSGLPSNALIVDELPDGTTPAGSDARGCGAVKSDGTFTFSYRPSDITDADTGDTITTYPGKIDTHQIGAAYGNHFWFTHTRSPETYPEPGDRMKVTGTWKLGSRITSHDGQAKVYAHIPDHGAQTSKAEYRITHAHGTTVKAVSQDANQSNKWVDLGAYFFTGMTPEVALHNFNGGDGSADIAYDAIAFVPGDYSGIPADLTFSDPDPNAPDPVPDETPNTVEGGFFPYESSATGLAAASTAAAAGDTASCSVTVKSVTYNRTDACIYAELSVLHVDGRTGSPDGSALFDYRNEIDTDVKSKTFTQKTTIKLNSMAGVMSTVDLDLGYMCRGYCSVDSVTWKGSDKWNKGDAHVATVTTKMSWTGSTGDSGPIVPYWTFGGKTNGDLIKNPLTVEKTGLDVRCDNEFNTVGAGCVFSWYKPTYAMNDKKFPAATAHIWLIRNKTKAKYGVKGGDPLTYLSDDVLVPNDDKSIYNHNRDTICPKAPKYVRSPDATLSTDIWPNDVPSCDEFPFARSWQSAATPKTWGGENFKQVSSGDECVNTIAKKGSDGKWRLVPDSRYHVPTWKEPCGRSSMSKYQNTQSMQPFPGWRAKNRVLEGDAYWLEAKKPS